MTESAYSGSGLQNRVWVAFVRAFPTAMTLVPVAMLCGVLAAQSGWSVEEVLLFSTLGFSGSGQFALIPLSGQGLGVLTMLFMAVSINSRYIPIAFATASRLPASRTARAMAAHMLGDEAYAVESERDSVASVVTIRATIYSVWILSNVAGVLALGLMPPGLIGKGINLGFPASVVLLVLSLGQLKVRVPRIGAANSRRIAETALCVIVAMALFGMLGKVWFWLPSIAFSTWRMWRAGA
ncbi:AzlC family ABC transporter permease [Caballeronia sp. BR00000012568055]|uniref:AzlC family ABC transporter permease n=1 Tax=Caballeronia sp. BR00000012568055 TaxID=2918761 RepID=UPI0023F795AE|nr:AzlC family ABC transporter permease [Caballeronia sp. BR00000012568055]